MALPKTKEERDANLDKLLSTSEEYFDSEEKRLDSETQFLRSILQGRGVSGVAALNLRQGVDLLQSEVSAFLFVESGGAS